MMRSGTPVTTISPRLIDLAFRTSITAVSPTVTLRVSDSYPMRRAFSWTVVPGTAVMRKCPRASLTSPRFVLGTVICAPTTGSRVSASVTVPATTPCAALAAASRTFAAIAVKRARSSIRGLPRVRTRNADVRCGERTVNDMTILLMV